MPKTSIRGKYAYVNTSSEQFACEKGGVMSIEPLYDIEGYNYKNKVLVGLSALDDIYHKILRVEKDLYDIKMQVSRMIEDQTDDGR